MPMVTIDKVEYDTDNLTEGAREQLASLQVCEQKLQQLQMEIAMIQTARSAYAMALREEMPEGEENLSIEEENVEH